MSEKCYIVYESWYGTEPVIYLVTLDKEFAIQLSNEKQKNLMRFYVEKRFVNPSKETENESR